MLVDLEPLAVVVPVLAARRDDDLVRRHLAEVVSVVHRAPQAGVDRCHPREHLRLVAERVGRRQRIPGYLRQVRARAEDDRRRGAQQADAHGHPADRPGEEFPHKPHCSNW